MLGLLLFSSVVLLLAMGLRWLFRTKVSSRLLYSLWLPVALCLLCAVLWIGQWDVLDQMLIWGIFLGQLLLLLWIAGMVAVGLWLILSNLSFQKQLAAGAEPLTDLQTPLPVFVTKELTSPCLMGVFHPRIYLTPESLEDPQICHHVLTHEATHYAQKDHIWSLLRCVCLCIYWFQPLAWLAAKLSKEDCELACDERVLQDWEKEQRCAYGQTLVEMTSASVRRVGLQITQLEMEQSPEQRPRGHSAVPVLCALLSIALGVILVVTALRGIL